MRVLAVKTLFGIYVTEFRQPKCYIIVENYMNSGILETVSWALSSVPSSHSAQWAIIPVKAKVPLTWSNLLAEVIMNTALAISIHLGKSNNQNLKIWHLTKVTEIWGWPALNSKCQIEWCSSVFQMEQGLNSSDGYTGQSWSGACPCLTGTEMLVCAASKFKGVWVLTLTWWHSFTGIYSCIKIE